MLTCLLGYDEVMVRKRNTLNPSHGLKSPKCLSTLKKGDNSFSDLSLHSPVKFSSWILAPCLTLGAGWVLVVLHRRMFLWPLPFIGPLAYSPDAGSCKAPQKTWSQWLYFPLNKCDTTKNISRAGSDSLQPNLYGHYEVRVKEHCLKFKGKKGYLLPFIGSFPSQSCLSTLLPRPIPLGSVDICVGGSDS